MENKIVLVGKGGVGKTNFVNYLIFGEEISNTYTPTLGVEVHTTDIGIMWDTAGLDEYGGLRGGYYIGSQYCIIMYENESEIQKFEQDYLSYASGKVIYLKKDKNKHMLDKLIDELNL